MLNYLTALKQSTDTEIAVAVKGLGTMDEDHLGMGGDLINEFRFV